MPKLDRYVYFCFYTMFHELKIIQFLYFIGYMMQKKLGNFKLSVTSPTN